MHVSQPAIPNTSKGSKPSAIPIIANHFVIIGLCAVFTRFKVMAPIIDPIGPTKSQLNTSKSPIGVRGHGQTLVHNSVSDNIPKNPKAIEVSAEVIANSVVKRSRFC